MAKSFTEREKVGGGGERESERAQRKRREKRNNEKERDETCHNAISLEKLPMFMGHQVTKIRVIWLWETLVFIIVAVVVVIIIILENHYRDRLKHFEIN